MTAPSSDVESQRELMRERSHRIVDLCQVLSESRLELVMSKLATLVGLADGAHHPDTILAFLDNIKSCLRDILGCLNALRQVPKPQPPTDKRGPATLLSLAVLRAIYTSVELIWTLVLRERVEKRIGCQLVDSCHPKSLLVSPQMLLLLREINLPHLSLVSTLEYLELVEDIIRSDSFVAMMQDRNLRRVALAHMVFADESGRRDLLDDLLLDKGLQPALVRELAAVLPECSADYREVITSVFATILHSEGGLLTMVCGYHSPVVPSFHTSSLS